MSGLGTATPLRRVRASLCAAFAVALLTLSVPALHSAVAGGTSSAPTPVSLGRALFADASLSASGAMSCASCHDPRFAHAQSNDAAVQAGGGALDVPGFRSVPSRTER